MSGLRLVITGAGGYIGKHLLKTAISQGHDVLVLGRAPIAGAAFQHWTMGERLPRHVLTGRDAVIHLAHSWDADAAGDGDFNSSASELLALDALAAGVQRFVFASSVSARAKALNFYGRSKFATEERLARLPQARGWQINGRIGLVYGSPPAGQYAMMRRLTALTPVLPMIGLDREVQPIHLDEVCGALLTMAHSHGLSRASYVIAGAPMRFALWLKLLRKVQTGGGLLLIPLPLGLALSLCRLAGRGLRERMLGLAGTTAVPDDLAALGLSPVDPLERLEREESGGSREALALLRYLGAKSSGQMVHDLSIGLTQAGLSPLRLPNLLILFPSLIALVEPPANRQDNRLASALYLAAQVVEAQGVSLSRPGLLRMTFLVLSDLLTLPLRLVTARRYQ